jgi:hypothetical protein
VTFHIRTAADLQSLRTRNGRAPRPDRLALDVEGLSEREARAWEATLSRYYFACGCEVGSVVLLLALVGYLAFLAVAPGGFGAATWGDGLRGVAVCLVAALTGKLGGLLHARFRLGAAIRSLGDRLAHARPAAPAPTS